MRENSCAFSGHRLLGSDFDGELLERIIFRLIKRGFNTFYCGMAMGFDLFAGETVVKLREQYGDEVRLIACIPHPCQSEKFSYGDKVRYAALLSQCNEKIIFSDRYVPGCMHARDRYMVDNSSAIVCYLRKTRGGTYYTVNYARMSGLNVIEI